MPETAPAGRCWPTGIPRLDQPLHGGLPRGALTEIVAGEGEAGSGTVLHALLRRAALDKQIAALVDGGDSLEVTQMDEAVLGRLLWVRAQSVDRALKAADLLLRDGNLSPVLLDLKLAGENQLRKAHAAMWYRFQRLLENSGAICVVFTPRAMVAPAQARVEL